MKYFLSVLLIITSVLLVQAQQINFHSTENIRKFADHLFCERDYLRAALEYENILNNTFNDTIIFKTAISYSVIQEDSLANKYFASVSPSSGFYDVSELERMKLYLLQSDFQKLKYFYTDMFVDERSELNLRAKKLFNVSLLLSGEELPPKNDFLVPFNNNKRMSSLYDWKQNPPYKNPILAGILSSIIPGSGKVYAGETGDGIVGFLTTAVFSFIAYDNFKAGHKTRGWIWAGVAALFYAGNVYGSVAAAQIHNAKITFEFSEGLNIYLNKQNYFIPEYDFCK